MTLPSSNSVYTIATGTTSTTALITYFSTVDPAPNNTQFPIQKRWFNTSSNVEWILVGFTTSVGVVSANWQRVTGSGGGGGDVNYLAGNTGGNVGPDGSHVINVVGGTNSGITVTGNPATNTLTITSCFDSVCGSTTTVGAVTGNVITFGLGATPGTYTFDCAIVGYNSSVPFGSGFTVVAGARTTGAAAVLLTGQQVDTFNETGYEPIANMIVSGNNIIFQVTGLVGETIDWTATANYIFIS